MKIQNALVLYIPDRSQRYFAHVTTVTLSWRVQNIVVIGRVYFTLECFEFSSNFEFDRNMLSGTGAWQVQGLECNRWRPIKQNKSLLYISWCWNDALQFIQRRHLCGIMYRHLYSYPTPFPTPTITDMYGHQLPVQEKATNMLLSGTFAVRVLYKWRHYRHHTQINCCISSVPLYSPWADTHNEGRILGLFLYKHFKWYWRILY